MIYHFNTREQLVAFEASKVLSLPFEVEVERVSFVAGRRGRGWFARGLRMRMKLVFGVTRRFLDGRVSAYVAFTMDAEPPIDLRLG